MLVVYCFFGLLTLALAYGLFKSPIARKLLRGQGVDPSQWGSWQEHLEDDGLGPSWRSDGWGGRRETKVFSKHTRRH